MRYCVQPGTSADRCDLTANGTEDTSPADLQLFANTTEEVLNRLEAFFSGDQRALAEMQAAYPKNQRTMTALYSAAFVIAHRSLNVVRDRLGDEEMQECLRNWRAEVDEMRRRGSGGA